MTDAAKALLTELGGRYAYTESDEISSSSTRPSTSSAARWRNWSPSPQASQRLPSPTPQANRQPSTAESGWAPHSTKSSTTFPWRQADAARCALNGWCYWTLRNEGRTPRQATRELERTSISAKNELLYARGINFNKVPAWQRRGVGLWWEKKPSPDLDVTATRNRIHTERDLPMKGAYRDLVRTLLQPD